MTRCNARRAAAEAHAGIEGMKIGQNRAKTETFLMANVHQKSFAAVAPEFFHHHTITKEDGTMAKKKPAPKKRKAAPKKAKVTKKRAKTTKKTKKPVPRVKSKKPRPAPKVEVKTPEITPPPSPAIVDAPLPGEVVPTP
jgi:hypothetical protein